jgi:hypothetical protein
MSRASPKSGVRPDLTSKHSRGTAECWIRITLSNRACYVGGSKPSFGTASQDLVHAPS